MYIVFSTFSFSPRGSSWIGSTFQQSVCFFCPRFVSRSNRAIYTFICPLSVFVLGVEVVFWLALSSAVPTLCGSLKYIHQYIFFHSREVCIGRGGWSTTRGPWNPRTYVVIFLSEVKGRVIVDLRGCQRSPFQTVASLVIQWSSQFVFAAKSDSSRNRQCTRT